MHRTQHRSVFNNLIQAGAEWIASWFVGHERMSPVDWKNRRIKWMEENSLAIIACLTLVSCKKTTRKSRLFYQSHQHGSERTGSTGPGLKGKSSCKMSPRIHERYPCWKNCMASPASRCPKTCQGGQTGRTFMDKGIFVIFYWLS